jgi:hypothetical protein
MGGFMVTSNYKNFNGVDYREVSISGDRGKLANYQGRCYPELAPKKDFWQVWHKNIGKISVEDNTKYYIEQYYKEVLSKLDPDKVYNDLEDKILLCYEEPNDFCHRHIVAEWIKLLFEEEVMEVKLNGNNIEPVIIEKNNLGFILEQVIRENTPNMRGFSSLKALRLFEKGEKAEQEALKFLEHDEQKYCDLMQYAAGLRCEADDTEQEYCNLHNETRKLVKK